MSKNRCYRPLVFCALLLAALTAAAEPAWLERYNRSMFSFNDKVDKNILKPVARAYKRVTPELVDRGISNFFSNLDDVIVIANDLLQLKFDQALADSNRFAINSTIGLLGIFDIATPLGLPKHDEDFGQTLGYWGVPEGYFLVLPLLGPTTTRDVWGLPADALLNPVSYVDPTAARFGLRAIELIDLRADLLSAERALSDALIDPYVFRRDAYLRQRRHLVSDGASTGADEDALFDELLNDDTPGQ